VQHQHNVIVQRHGPVKTVMLLYVLLDVPIQRVDAPLPILVHVSMVRAIFIKFHFMQPFVPNDLHG
jgi:hypothetical protein